MARFFNGGFFLLLWVFSGCVVQSVQPFAPREKMVDAPKALMGEWKIIKYLGDGINDDSSEVKVENWKFDEESITVYDKKNRKGVLKYGVFKLKDDYCLMAYPEGIDTNNINELYGFHLAPMYTCSFMILGDKELVFYPMCYEKIYQYHEENKLDHLVISEKDQYVIFNVKPSRWYQILEQLKDKDLFLKSDEIRLIRVEKPAN